MTPWLWRWEGRGGGREGGREEGERGGGVVHNISLSNTPVMVIGLVSPWLYR